MRVSLSEYEYLEADSSQTVSTHVEEPHAETLAGRLAEEMAAAWRRGDRLSAEVFLIRHAELSAHPDAALRLIYEEVCLRQEAGETVTPEEVIGRFPQWRAELHALFECHEVLQPAAEPPPFPQVGEMLGDFRLLKELGRGALGRVFLAAQTSLRDRLVVLKLTPRAGQEHLSLAQLQHTHIVPLFAFQDFPTRDLRLLCMPYLGGTTLARLLEALRIVPVEKRTGQQLLDILDRSRVPAPPDLPIRAPIRKSLARASYVEAVCWIGVCLADALQYAHERNLIHLDVKPSNVLLAADGQPMLLDFHLTREPLKVGGPAPEWLGGTHAYMSPEQRAALTAVREGRTFSEAVTGRSDIYTLGLVLYEALCGVLPIGRDALRLDRSNPRVSVGLADIVHKCLAHSPRDRYPDATTLAADLRRHLAYLPLRSIANRSLRERWRKWRRRRPHALVSHGLILASVLVVATGGALGLDFMARERQSARTGLEEGRDGLRRGRPDDAVSALTRALERAETLPGGSDLAEALRGEVARAKRAVAVRDLHVLIERLRLLYDTAGILPKDLRVLADRCRQVWQARVGLLTQEGGELEPAVERRLHLDLLDLALLWADFQVRQAPAHEADSARRQALSLLDEAESLLGGSHALHRQRQVFAGALGLHNLAAEAAGRAAKFPPQTAWDHTALGRMLLRSGQYDHAQAEFREALNLDPGGFWPNFYQGVCAYRRERHAEAFAAFHACVALAPEIAECFYNRALARTALGNLDEALSDYDRALWLDPALAVAVLNRGIIQFKKSNSRAAAADLHKALEMGADPAAVHYNLAVLHLAQDDRPAARTHLERALHHEPRHVEALELQERLRTDLKTSGQSQ